MRTLLHAPRTRRSVIAAATLGALALIGSMLVATPAQALSDTGTGGVFVPSSGRVLDTANGTGGYSTPMAASTWRTIQVAGLAGVPDDGSVGSVSINATVSGAPGNGTLFARPDASTAQTMVLIYNGTRGEYTSNTGNVALGADGTIQVKTETSARLILDVQGYYTASADGTAPGGFVPVAGKRIVDTRSGLGAPKVILAAGSSTTIQVAGSNGVPADASGAVVNLTAINATAADGYLTPYAADAARPSNALHYAPSSNSTIQAQTDLSADGKITIYNGSTTANLVVDLQGYFTATSSTGAVFTPGAGRMFDSRSSGSSIVARGETRSIGVAGVAGVPVMGSGVTAVVVTLTAVHPGSEGRAVVWADGTTRPDVTSISFRQDEIRTNTITVPLGANGKISLYNIADPTDYVIDIQGWYATTQKLQIECAGPYTANSWNTYPKDDVDCRYFAGKAYGTDQTLRLSNGGTILTELPLSQNADSQGAFHVPVHGGQNVMTASVMGLNGNILAQRSLTFAIGDWATSPVTTTPTEGASFGEDMVSLSVESTFDSFEEGTKTSFTVLAADSSGLPQTIAESGETDGSWDIPSGTLESNELYSWRATIAGPSGSARTESRLTTPLHTFSTVINAADENEVVVAGEVTGSSESDSTMNPYRADQGEDPKDVYREWYDKKGYKNLVRNGVFYQKVVNDHRLNLRVLQSATISYDSRGDDDGGRLFIYLTTFYRVNARTGKITGKALVRVPYGKYNWNDGQDKEVISAYCVQANKERACPEWLK